MNVVATVSFPSAQPVYYAYIIVLIYFENIYHKHRYVYVTPQRLGAILEEKYMSVKKILSFQNVGFSHAE